jgi:hypothetical protein
VRRMSARQAFALAQIEQAFGALGWGVAKAI